MTQTGGEIYHVLGLDESVLSKYIYYLKYINIYTTAQIQCSAIPIKLPRAFSTELE